LSEYLSLKPDSIHREIRETLFGDLPLSRLIQSPPGTLLAEPWNSFARARDLIAVEDREGARNVLRNILQIPNLDTRVCLQAWHSLREAGETPPQEKEKEVLGVVVEVGMPKGLDLVAAYADHRARYFIYSGGGILWERQDDSFDKLIDDVLKAGAAVVRAIQPWKQSRPPEPKKGNVRINLLTPSGLHLGQGPIDSLKQDPMGGPILLSAFKLSQKLMALTKKELPFDSIWS
jgi:hypothetical protein